MTPTISIRVPDDFHEFDGEEIMSNFDREINRNTERCIKGNKMFSRYAGWNFNGLVWWDKPNNQGNTKSKKIWTAYKYLTEMNILEAYY